MQFPLALTIDDPDGGEHTETVDVTLCGVGDEGYLKAIDEQGNDLKLTEYQQELCLIEAKGLM